MMFSSAASVRVKLTRLIIKVRIIVVVIVTDLGCLL